MYADLLFLSEFLFDYLILNIVKEWTGYNCTFKRLILGSLIGAFISTLLSVCYSDTPVFFNFIMGIVLCFAMIKTAFKPISRNSYLYLICYCYAVAVIQGGIIAFIRNRYPEFPIFFLFIIGFTILKISMFVKKSIGSKISKLCQVSLKTEHRILRFTALMDTGNMLFDSERNLPVSIIYEKDLPKEVINQTTKSIKFNSLGCTNGNLKIIYVPYICIEYKGEKKLIENVPLGLSPHKLSTSDSYQMIISPEIINKMEI